MAYRRVDGLEYVLLAFKHVIFHPLSDVLNLERYHLFFFFGPGRALKFIVLSILFIAVHYEKLFVFKHFVFKFQNFIE